MIKRIVGLLAAAAILAVIVFTILGAGSYTSYFDGVMPRRPTRRPLPRPLRRTHRKTTAARRAPTTENAADSVAAGTPPRQKPRPSDWRRNR